MRTTVSQDAFSDVFQALCKGANTAVSLGLWMRWKHGEHKQLAEASISPSDYLSADTFDRDWLCSKFVSKYTGLRTGIDTKEVAFRGWEAAESQCRQANHRLRLGRANARVSAVLHMAQRKISEVLGPCCPTILDEGRWGTGATATLPGSRSTLVDKIGESPISVTSGAVKWLQIIIGADPHWCESMGIRADGVCCLLDIPENFLVVPGNRGTTVPKSAKTDRSIAMEPTGNIFLQLAIGRYLKRRLRRVGVDLTDQSLNQRLALEGSLGDLLATLDLSSASDTICKGLVRDLLPLDWVLLLDSIRSASTTWGEDHYPLEKYSSMGNGFTFEVESLIFWALASSASEHEEVEGQVGIYGDDIIVHRQVAPLLTEVLEYCGFTLNKEKSYVSGAFRESCGRHYWSGLDVTPIYQKEVPDTLPELYRLANRLNRACFNRDMGDRLDRTWLLGAWRCAVSHVHRELCEERSWPYTPGQTYDELLVIGQLGGHFVPIWDESDDGLALRDQDLLPFIYGYDPSRGIQLRVLAFRALKRQSDAEALLAYSLRFPGAELGNSVPEKRRGRYIGRRRWFAGVHFALPEL